MSHFIASSLLSRASATVTSASNTMVSSVMPALPKLGYSCQVRNLHMLTNSYRSTKQQQHMERIQNNMARVYARRVLELAAMSAATLASTTALEAAIEKPPEWSTIDLAEERRKFGENFSTLGKSAISRVWAAGSRLFNLGLLASPLAILVPVAYITAPITSKPNQLAWDYAVWSAEKAGPTFIKLIQWATTRNDLFPSQFIEHFAVLQDSTRGHSWKETEKLLKSSLGDNWEEWFEFESVKSGSRPNDVISPIGSGCIAQVYKAKLKKSTGMLPAGSHVAIKVTHPNILHKVCVDFYILNKVTSWLEAIPYINLDYLSIKDSVQQFRDIMLPQLDLRVEARNLKRFRRDFSGDERVSFPQPISELTSEKVLVESFVHGEPILKFCIEGRKSNKDREDLAKVGLSTVMKMIFLHDFVHGDLHPGNIIVDRNTNAKGHPYRLNMIDCGLIVEMGEQDHVNLVKVLGAFIKKDGYLAAQLMIDSSKKCNSSELDIELFCKGIQRIIELDQERHFLESVGDYLADICYLACKHKVKLEASFINAALACEIMEGIASKLYPTLEVQHIALPMVVKAEFMHGLKSYKKDWF